jgi:hypothetical protein
MTVGAYCRIRLSDGRVVDLGPGDIIGRLETATLRINEPQLSEAHALVSLRGEQLVLLALRGVISVGGRPVSSAQLVAGAEIQLSRRSGLTVLHAELPESALGVKVGGRPVEVLRRSTYSLSADGALVARFLPEALAHLWSSEEGWFSQVGEEEPIAVDAGDRVVVGDWELELVSVPLERSGVAPTVRLDALFPAMRIVARYETVNIYRVSSPPVQLGGLPARLISELASFASPTPWKMLAEQLWPGETDAVLLRQRLDRSLARLRRKLRHAGLRADLVKASGSGDYELLLYPGDEIVEEG